MRARVLCLVSMLLVACSQSQPTAGVSQKAVVSPTAQATPRVTSSPVSSATPVATLGPSPAAVTCELPFLPTDGYQPFHAVGFLTLPEGTFRPDATAESSLPPGGVRGNPTPGGTQPWWDAQAKRWIPADLSAVSPDGLKYAYLGTDALHQVVVATGADSMLYRRPPGVLGGEVLGYFGGAVYIVFPVGVKNGSGGAINNPTDQVGVWKVDLATRAAARIFQSDSLGVMAGGGLWSAGSELIRVDVVTGQRTVWFTSPSQFMQFLGFDVSRTPLVWTFDGAGHLDVWHITAPDQATDIYSLDYTGAPHLFGPERQQGLLVADAHGVWFGASDGVWLYDGANLRQVSTASGIPAGPCR